MEKGKVGVAVVIIVAIVTLLVGLGIGFGVTMIIKSFENKNIETILVQDTQKQANNEVNGTTNSTIAGNNMVNDTVTNQNTTTTGERVLTQAELDLFENYLNTPTIWNFLFTTYSDISEFNLQGFLRYYFYNDSIASEEKAKEITGEEHIAVPIHLYSKDIIDATFKKYTGKDVSVIKTENLPRYYEKLNTYYNGTSDYETITIDVISGKQINDKFVLIYNGTKLGETKQYELTMNRVNGQYLFVSNIKK